VLRAGGEREGLARLAPYGVAAPADPSLEDVFVSLARSRAAGTEEAA
jgi:hypothetical protein